MHNVKVDKIKIIWKNLIPQISDHKQILVTLEDINIQRQINEGIKIKSGKNAKYESVNMLK